MSRPPDGPADPPGDPPSDTPRLMGIGGIVASLFFLVVWLGPITYVGSAGRDLYKVGDIDVHRDLRHMHRVACLFTREVGAWGTYHIEVRPDRGAEWVELPLDGYFDMSIFGYRTRFHRLLGKSYRRRGGRNRARYMARWIADRYAALNPDAPPLYGVRFVSASRTVEELLKEEGRFHKRPLAEMRRRRTKVLLTFEGREMRYVSSRGKRAGGGQRAPSPRDAKRARPRPKPQPLPKALPRPKSPDGAGRTGEPPLRPLPVPAEPVKRPLQPVRKRPLEALPRPKAPEQGGGGER